MNTLLAKAWKKMSSVLLAAVMVLNTVPSAFAVGTLSIAFNVAGSTNFPAGTNIPFNINTTPVTNSTNTLTDGAFPDGTFTLTATLPANTQIGAGAGYNVTGTNTLSFTMTSGATLNLTINITDTVVVPPPAATSTLTVAFNVAGASNFPAGTNIPFNISTTPVTNSTNTLSDGAFPVGTFTLTATLPANTQIAAGANYNVTGTTTATFTTTAGGTLNLTINIGNTAGGGPGAGTSTLSVAFNTAAASNFPAGTNIPFNISTTPVTNSTNTLNDGAFPVGTFTLTATLPANTQIGAGANYTVTGTTTLTFTTTAGGTLNLSINIVNTAGGGPGAGTSTLSIAFNTAGSTNFPVGTNIPFSISTTPITNSTNTLNDGAFPVGTFTLTATLPANTQIGAGANYVVTGGTTLTFTTTAGGTLNLSINIVNTGGGPGPGPGGNGTLNLSFTTPATFPVGTNIPFTINTTPITNGTNTLTNATIAAGNYTLSATLPAGFEIVTGPNYGVPSISTAIFTIVGGATLNLNIQVVAAGNSGRPRGTVSITFTDENNQTITSKSISIGQSTTVTVTGIDSRGGNVNLSLSQDPSSTKTSKAVFTVPTQGLLTTVGTFTWTPSADSLGTNQFVFTGTNGTTIPTDAILTINVTTNITSGGGGNGGSGGSGGGGGFRTPDLIIDNSEKFEKCRFKDNQTESVIYLCMLGIIDQPTMDKDFGGKSKNMQYFGKDPITRAAFTKIMINITYDESDIEKVAKLVLANNYFPFPDVEPIAWFAKYIAVGQLDNHIHGYPHLGLFIPWNDIEVSEAVKILFNTARHDNKKIAADLDQAVIDAGSEPWFMRFALLAYAYGGYTPVLDKDPGMIYSQKLNRQQAADIIYTTILNAGLETKGKLSALKQELMDLQESVQTEVKTEATI